MSAKPSPFASFIAKGLQKASTPSTEKKPLEPPTAPLSISNAGKLASSSFVKAVKANDEKQLAALLLDAKDGNAEKVAELLAKVSKIVNDSIAVKNFKAAEALKADTATTVCKLENVSMISPRGRFNTTWFPESVDISKPNGKESYTLRYSNVCELISLPDAHKKNERFFVLYVSEITKQMIGKEAKKLENHSVVINSGTGQLNMTLQAGDRTDLPSQISGSRMEGLTKILPALCRSKLVADDKQVFNSTTGKPFLKCYHGTSDGLLYPLTNGLLFCKPFKFVPRDDIAGLSTAKVGTGRTFNVNITLHTGSPIEFTALEIEEINAMKAYMAWILKRAEEESKGRDGDEEGDEEDGDDDSEDGDVDSDEDEDFDEGEDSDSEGSCSDEELSCDDCDGYDADESSKPGAGKDDDAADSEEEKSRTKKTAQPTKHKSDETVDVADSSGLSSDEDEAPKAKKQKI